jgi:hypothetical protein
MAGWRSAKRANASLGNLSTIESRSAVTVAVRIPSAKKPISPIGDAPSVDSDREAAGGDEIERVSGVALAHQNLAAGDRPRHEQLLELAKILWRQIAEGFDQRQRSRPRGASCLGRLSCTHRRPSPADWRPRAEDSAEAAPTVRGSRKRRTGSSCRAARYNRCKSPETGAIGALLRRQSEHLLDVIPIDQIVEPSLEIFRP